MSLFCEFFASERLRLRNRLQRNLDQTYPEPAKDPRSLTVMFEGMEELRSAKHGDTD